MQPVRAMGWNRIVAMWLGCVGIAAGCGPSEDDDPASDSGDSGESDDSGGQPPTSEDDGPPLDDGGCPSDMDLIATAPKPEAVEGLDEDTLDGDPRFFEAFCASFCPDPPDAYLLSYCGPVDVADLLPSDGSTGTSDTGTGDSGSDDALVDIRCHYWPGCM